MSSENTMDIHSILSYLPHRYPFLLIDRIVDYKAGEYLTAYKNITYNENYFVGHFPIRPIMPGVLILEALAQATGILAFKTNGTMPSENSLYYFVGIDKARFKQPVEPGDQLFLEVKLEKKKGPIWKFITVAKVDGKVVATADIMCAEKDI
jgi:3-hydroxyacyl-[acyl-carrier-protein] dehydratase